MRILVTNLNLIFIIDYQLDQVYQIMSFLSGFITLFLDQVY